jgi:hypothetical protein
MTVEFSRKCFGGWPYPINILYPGDIRRAENGILYMPLNWRRGSIDLRPIVSASQAFAMQRAIAKKFHKYLTFHKKESLGLSGLNCLLAIEPGALFFYSSVEVGTKAFSRKRLPGANLEDYPSCLNVRGIVGTVVVYQDYVRYTAKVYTKVLNVIPKHIVKEALKCSNG